MNLRKSDHIHRRNWLFQSARCFVFVRASKQVCKCLTGGCSPGYFCSPCEQMKTGAFCSFFHIGTLQPTQERIQTSFRQKLGGWRSLIPSRVKLVNRFDYCSQGCGQKIQ
eukprot:05658_6